MTTPPAAVAVAPAPLPTIGEVLRAPRVLVWIVGVYLPSVCLAVPTAVAYYLHYTPDIVVPTDGGGPWRLLPLVLWGVYMALVTAETAYMELFLPRAPMAALKALVDVGCVWVALPLSWMATAAALLAFVRTWMLISVVCLFVVLIAAFVALWVWLVRTYSTSTGHNMEDQVGKGGSDWFPALFLQCIKPYVEESKPVLD